MRRPWSAYVTCASGEHRYDPDQWANTKLANAECPWCAFEAAKASDD